MIRKSWSTKRKHLNKNVKIAFIFIRAQILNCNLKKKLSSQFGNASTMINYYRFVRCFFWFFFFLISTELRTLETLQLWSRITIPRVYYMNTVVLDVQQPPPPVAAVSDILANLEKSNVCARQNYCLVVKYVRVKISNPSRKKFPSTPLRRDGFDIRIIVITRTCMST